jgi:amino acid adenylation domain-containing protein
MNTQVNTIKNSVQFDPFSGPEIEKVIYTTQAQEEIWTACYFGGNDSIKAYNESITIAFNGVLDSKAIKKAAQTLVDRHEALRAVFSTDGIYMSVFKQLHIEVAYQNLSNLEESSKNKALQQYLEEEANYLFDLVSGPLIKFGLIKLSDHDHQLIITAHHIICDGWSVGIMLQDLGALYSAYVENKIPEIAESIPFSIYANEEQLFLNSPKNKEIEKYWHEMYENSIPITNLPTDVPRPSQRTYKSDRLDFPLDPHLLAKIKQTGLAFGASLVTTLLTSFEVFLYQLTAQEDFVVGLPSAGQSSTGLNHLIGHCVNLLPLRTKITPNSTFKDYLKKRKTELFDAYDHQQISFGHLLQLLNVARDPSRVPLVPIVFNIDLGITDGVEFTNLNYTINSNPRAFETFDIFLNASGSDKNLVFEWSFNSTLFKQKTIEQMMLSFEGLLQKIVDDPTKTLEQITYQDYTSEYNKLNDTTASYPTVSLPDLFSIQAQKTPNAIALEFFDSSISYKNTQEQVNQMAHYLQGQGVASGDLVAVALPRATELVITLLAIMQCGAAYLPLDNDFPIARLQFMMDDAEAKFLLTSAASAPALPQGLHTILIEEAFESLNQYSLTKLQSTVDPNEVAYLMYTSGSTGNPKGVPITHKNLVNFLCSMAIQPGIDETDRVLSITTISFDIAGLELYLPLINGATLVLANSETTHDTRLLLDLIKNKKISFLQATPTTWQMLLDSGWSQPLPIKALCGGEALPLDLAKKLVEKCDSLWNMYGPTETTIWSSLKQIKATDSQITIGKPIANTQLYIINENGKLLAPGNIGEIAIGGDGLASGYWNREELTNEKFIINEFSDSKIILIYKTGDLGKLLPNNEIVCLGRLDHQVKIRGHRIELGEVEQALIAIDGIKNGVVLANENFLTAHIIPDSPIENAKSQIPFWRKSLTSQLPSHLIPHHFNILKEFPTTLNGKIDRKALLQYQSTKDKDYQYTAPRTATEELVAAIWKESLQLKQVDIFSNFFEMGGHSIMAVKVMIKIEKETGKRIPLSALFEHSTVEKFAQLIHVDNPIDSDYLVPIKPQGSKVPLFMVHGAGLNILNFVNVIKHFDKEQPVYGIQGTGPKDLNNWFESIEEMAAHYIQAIIKINPNGPYAIAGFSFGGIVAFEMARQLKEQGKTVSIIALLDTYVDSSYVKSSSYSKKVAKYYDRTRRRLHVLKEICMGWQNAKLYFKNKKKYIEEQYLDKNNELTAEEAIAHQEFIIANQKVSTIVNRYHLKPQDLEVHLFRAKDDDTYKLDPTHLGWKGIALKGLHIHDIPGVHIDIVAPPNDKILADMLQNVLDSEHANNAFF